MEGFCAHCQKDVVIGGLNACPVCDSDMSGCLDDYCDKCEGFSEDLVDGLCLSCLRLGDG